jgi:hypothetical protein
LVCAECNWYALQLLAATYPHAIGFSGTLTSIPVLIAFSQAINVQWIPLSYFLANMVLQGAFLSGMFTLSPLLSAFIYVDE